MSNDNSSNGRRKYSRFRFVSEPLTSITHNDEIRKPDFPFANDVLTRRYPVRALRYWWLNAAIAEEAARLASPPAIADIGCDTGLIKRFVLPIEGARWTGLDLDISRPGVEQAKYDELHQCDFDQRLPLEDGAFDIVIFSHVLEHLPRPEFTMAEAARILKPGGMMLLATPTAPKTVAKFVEKKFNRQLKEGTRRVGQHIHCFWPERLRQMAENEGLVVEFSAGSAVIRKRNSRLEDHAAWIRMNQIAAGLFPSIGREVCLQLRKPL